MFVHFLFTVWSNFITVIINGAYNVVIYQKLSDKIIYDLWNIMHLNLFKLERIKFIFTKLRNYNHLSKLQKYIM